MSERNEIVDTLLEYFRKRAENAGLSGFSADTDIRELGMDSLALAALVAFLQRTFKVRLKLEDVLDAENFSSVYRITVLVRRRLAGSE